MARDNERPVRRRTLTRDKVIDAALAVVDEHGWQQLTMSTLANRVGVVGASLFFASDALIAWNRFIGETRQGALAIIITYHLAQVGLVLSLV